MDLRHASHQARKRERAAGGHEWTVSEYDGQDLAWRRRLADHIRYRLKQQTRWTSNAARGYDDPPPF
jgi:hypothetical protein